MAPVFGPLVVLVGDEGVCSLGVVGPVCFDGPGSSLREDDVAQRRRIGSSLAAIEHLGIQPRDLRVNSP